MNDMNSHEAAKRHLSKLATTGIYREWAARSVLHLGLRARVRACVRGSVISRLGLVWACTSFPVSGESPQDPARSWCLLLPEGWASCLALGV